MFQGARVSIYLVDSRASQRNRWPIGSRAGALVAFAGRQMTPSTFLLSAVKNPFARY